MSGSPQLEDGYIKIANELFDAVLRYPFTSRQQKVVMAIMRKTYGYNKKRDDVSASQIAELCGLQRNHVTTTLNELAAMNVIFKVAGEYGSVVEINKNYRSWTSPKSGLSLVPNQDTPLSQIRTSSEISKSLISIQGCPELGLVDENAASPKSGQVASPKSGHTKDNFPKDIKPLADTSKRSARKTPMPADFGISENVRRWANEKGHTRLEQHFENFVGAAKARGYSYVDWDSAFQNAVRNNWAKLPVSGVLSDGSKGWWQLAGFGKEWEALSAGATESNAKFWKDRRPTRKLSGVSIEPWEETV